MTDGLTDRVSCILDVFWKRESLKKKNQFISNSTVADEILPFSAYNITDELTDGRTDKDNQ